jgi:Protein of unknown function (DUF642)
MTRSSLGVLGFFPLLFLAQQANAANLLVNGDFELPVQGAPNFAAFNVGTQTSTTFITGWTVTQGNVDLTTTANYGPGPNTLDPSSVQDVDLIGDTNGSNGVKGGISQSFATVAGQQYQLTFDYSHNNGNFSPTYAALVTVADGNAPPGSSIFSTTVSQAFITGVGFPSGGWQTFSQDFTATSVLTVLSFIDTQGAFNAGIYLDDVSVDLVNATTPIPGALPLFASGAGVLSFFGWRRKKKSAALSA